MKEEQLAYSLLMLVVFIYKFFLYRCKVSKRITREKVIFIKSTSCMP
ncbi:hypothetical protein AC3_2336 [Clostridium perfringens E str. JGS1987]|uniref:Uncharacterized protein n=1 Tax=Clostridium perfringens E str. JGS1987 TaxID=451755 RepID=B1BTA3_CLOPF|nr:hypothetical protein AC3_2336 [Clostridium perfringens E str. JGS1987]